MKKYSPEDLQLWAQFAASATLAHVNLNWRNTEAASDPEGVVKDATFIADAMMEQLELRRDTTNQEYANVRLNFTKQQKEAEVDLKDYPEWWHGSKKEKQGEQK